MPSADFCNTIKPDHSGFSASVHTPQTSRGKTLNFPRDNAPAISLTFGSAITWYQNFHLTG